MTTKKPLKNCLSCKPRVPSMRPVASVLVIAFAFALFPGQVLAQAATETFSDCAIRKLVDFVDYAAVMVLVEALKRFGIRNLERALGERAVQSALLKLAKALGKRVVPFFGFLFIMLALTELIWDCLPLLV